MSSSEIFFLNFVFHFHLFDGVSAKSTNHNWYNCHLYVPQFFQFPSKVEVLILLFTFFQFYCVVSWDSTVYNFANYFFCWLLLGLVFWPRLGDLYVCQSPIEVYVCNSLGHGLYIYHLFIWSTLNFCTNLLYLLMWLIVLSLSPHYLHLLFCCILSILTLIWLGFMALFCAAIRRDSVSFLRFPFLSHIQVFLCELLLISLLKCL